MFNKGSTLLIVIMLCVFSLSTHAQNQGGVKVGGNVTIKAETDNVVTVAGGNDAIAETNIASVTGHNTEVSGDVSIDVKTDNVVTVAGGRSAKACSNIGTVGTSACQKDDN